MSTTIGSVTLDNDMFFLDELKDRQVVSTVTDTVGGGVNIQQYDKSEIGRLVTLESRDGLGYQQRSTVEALQTLANAVDTTYSLSISKNGQTFSKTVVFRNEVDPSPVDFEPSFDVDGLQEDGFWYGGSIYLMVAS